ncbi:MAG: Gfo/Idh/MocA family oxidoreductase [Verrucomicrobiota bacterium JB022]|nr:Gfo/Idh/MocA family oxidoreductase [Verrucomicrobiota bacterium JB022]
MKKLGLGVLGLGEGRSIISGCLSSDRVELIRLCDLNEDLCKQRAAEFKFPHYTTSYDELLADPKIDIIGIYTPDQLHARHICQALEAGKHVICTKPFLDSLESAQQVLDLVRKTGKRVFVGQSTRFFAPFTRQHEHFQTGEFGELITIEAQYHADHRWFLKKPWATRDDFKWLYGCISHPADLVRWYLGDIEEVMGYGTLSPNGKAGGLAHEDTFHFILKSTSGHIARVSGAYSGPTVPIVRDSGMSCVIRGTEGASQADYHELRYTWKIGERNIQESFEHQMNHYFRFEGISHHAGEYQNYLDYFADCLYKGEVPKPDVEEGIVTIALLQAMDESLAAGKPIKVRDILARYGLDSLV